MCEPTIVMAISAASAGLSYIEGQQNIANQAEATNNATRLGYEQENERLSQVNEQAAVDKTERIKQGLLERAKTSTIAGESGALGISSDRLVLDSFMQEGTDIATLEKNRLNQEKQSSYNNQQLEMGGNNANRAAASSAPSLLATGLSIGGTAYAAKAKAKEAAKAKAIAEGGGK